jgi:hypothetical protein
MLKVIALTFILFSSCITVEREKIVTIMQKPLPIPACEIPKRPDIEFSQNENGETVLGEKESKQLFTYIIELREYLETCNQKISRHNQVYSRQ